MQAFDDESLLSYMLRTLFLKSLHLTNKWDAFDGAINFKKGFKIFPTAPNIKGIQNLFHQGTSELLIQKAEETLIGLGYQPSFFHPYTTSYLVEQFYGRSDSHIDINGIVRIQHNFVTDLQFCEECLKEQIYDFGVSYLKNEWIFSGRCKEHDQKLKRININSINSKKKKLEAIMSVFSGSVPIEYQSQESCFFENSEIRPIDSKECSEYYAPCLSGLFLQYIKDMYHKSWSDSECENGTEVRRMIDRHSSAESMLSNDFYGNKAIDQRDLQSVAQIPFAFEPDRFWEENKPKTDLIGLSYDGEILHTKFEYRALRSRDCQGCSETYCPLKLN